MFRSVTSECLFGRTKISLNYSAIVYVLVGFEVLNSSGYEGSVFWDMTLHSLLKVN
jgi:hypothetical protein